MAKAYDNNVDMMRAVIREAVEKTWKTTDIEEGEIIAALLVSLGDMLLNIECPDSRRLHKKHIEKALPSLLREVMKYAASTPQLGEHVH
jgi:hypothetical protein